ncbi:Uncharacterised protein [Klebsiella aerogenes]|nr:Uncharacterised protein [Klebsiella aerogenes]
MQSWVSGPAKHVCRVRDEPETGDTGISIGTSGTLYGITNKGITDSTGTINGYADAADRFIP